MSIKKGQNKILKSIVSIVCNLIIIGTSCWLLYWVIIITTTCSFHVPTESMLPTLMPDDCGLINKWKMGARIFNIIDAAEGKPYKIGRLPGYCGPERGDIVIFNYPYGKNNDSIMMNLHTYYCKRAVAIAGDSLEIRDCFYHVRGCNDTFGVSSEQLHLQRHINEYRLAHPDTRDWPGSMKCAPKDSLFNWTISDMGPILIPANGTVIELTYRHWLLYRKYIEWETGKKLFWSDGAAISDGKIIKSYRFKENYFFAAGDHVIDSRDSRYFGLVPEKFVAGTVCVVWDRKKKRLKILESIHFPQ